jgi:low affinity Fe/Cu permease
LNELFRRFSSHASRLTGTASAFLLAFLVVFVWALTGPIFHFSDTWQLVINTGTTIVTFLMVFLIQNTQNRDSAAFHAKLDELVIALKGASNEVVSAEDLSDEDLRRLHDHYHALAEKAEDVVEGREESQDSSSPSRSR